MDRAVTGRHQTTTDAGPGTAAAIARAPVGTPASSGESRESIDARTRTRLLKEARDTVLDKLSAVVTSALDRMADQLADEALRATRTDQQRALLDAAMLVREQRSLLESGFRAAFSDVFERRLAGEQAQAAPSGPLDLDSLSLVPDEVISAKLDMDRRVHRARSRLDPEQVLGMRARLGALVARDWFDENQHPVAPGAVFEALRDSVGRVVQSEQVVGVMLDAFEPHVLQNLNQIYANVNSRLVAHHVLPQIRHPGFVPAAGATHGGAGMQAGAAGLPGGAHGGAGAPGHAAGGMAGHADPGGQAMTQIPVAELAQLQQMLLAHGVGQPAGRAHAARLLSNPGMFGAPVVAVDPVSQVLLDALSRMQQDAQATMLHGESGGAHPHPEGLETVDGLADPRWVRETLTALLQKARQSGSPLDQVTVELVSVVFEHIENDPALAESLRHQLLRLQVVAVKAALLDRSFFARRTHPMRQLIDRVSQVAADPDVDLRPDSPLVDGVRVVFDQLLDEFDSDLSVFERACERIEEIVREEDARRVEQIEAQLRAAERQEALAMEIERARDDLAALTEDETPAFVRDFLDVWWAQVVAGTRVEARSVAAQGGAADGEATATLDARAMRIAEFLVWSVAAKQADEVPRLATMLPKLIRALNDGTQVVHMPGLERETFLDNLMQAHTRTIDAAKRGRTGPQGASPDESRPGPSSHGTSSTSSSGSRPAASPVGTSSPGPATLPSPPSSSRRSGRSTPARRPATTTPAADDRLKDWGRGDRIQIVSESGETTDYKLAWVSPARQLFILSRFPKETRTFSSADLAALVGARQAMRADSAETVGVAIDGMTRMVDDSEAAGP